MSGWAIGFGAVLLLVLVGLLIRPRRLARPATTRRRNGQGDGAGFLMTGDTGRSNHDRDKASPTDADDTGTSDGGDGGGD